MFVGLPSMLTFKLSVGPKEVGSVDSEFAGLGLGEEVKFTKFSDWFCNCFAAETLGLGVDFAAEELGFGSDALLLKIVC